jgi:hypothetical protein
VGVLARHLAQALRIGQYFTTGEQVLELFVAFGELFEFAADGGLHFFRAEGCDFAHRHRGERRMTCLLSKTLRETVGFGVASARFESVALE